MYDARDISNLHVFIFSFKKTWQLQITILMFVTDLEKHG